MSESKSSDAGAGAGAAAGKEAVHRVGKVKIVKADTFEPEEHFYPRVLNSTIHPLVRTFLTMTSARIMQRYVHMHPSVDRSLLEQHIMYKPKYFKWAGCDTFNTATPDGARRTIVVETNSCPSGQKSMPLASEDDETGGYRRLLEHTFAPMVAQEKCAVEGRLAVVYDKNLMEASGYAATLADITGEDVILAEFYSSDKDPPVRFDDGVMKVRMSDGEWVAIRAAFRYVTQRPWNRIPLVTKTLILNPICTCISGGRNKLLADKAYELFNGELASEGSNLRIHTPETIRDVGKAEVPLWVKNFGGHAVVKVPYSNAGQGVYTILNDEDLEAFMTADSGSAYDKYIVQSLVGNSKWSSVSSDANRYYHIGTIPNRRGEIFVTDVRMMVAATDKGYKPIAVYARRAHEPLTDGVPTEAGKSWAMLGTNLSKKLDTDTFTTESSRLLLMDSKDFNRLGIGIDDLMEAYVQTVLAAIAIDKMCERVMGADGLVFNRALFKSLNDDEALISEIVVGDGGAEAADGEEAKAEE